MSLKVALVTNSLAGNGRAIALASKIKSILSQKAIHAQIFRENEWDKAIYNFDQVWIVGGDGTVNYFINRFNDIKVPLAIFNGGTGNDFHALLYGKIKLEDQVNKVLTSNQRHIDVGKCNEKYFLNGVGLGFEGAVAKSLTGNKKFRGKTSFMIQILKHIFLYEEKMYTIKSENRSTEQTCLLISVANGRRYAGGFYIAPLADPSDGLLEAIVVNKLSVFQRLKYLPVIEKGKHLRLPVVKYFQTKKISISGSGGMIQAHLDGEYYQAHELTIEVLPGHFKFLF